MADETRVIRIVIDSSKAVDGGRAAQKALEDIERNTGTLGRAVTGLESTFRSLFAGYLGIQGVRMLVETADAFTKFTNSLKTAGVESANLGLVQDRLFAAANKNGVEIGALGQVYGRLTMSAKELGASTGDMLKFVDGVTAALRVQGGSTEQASGALLQLSQAMGAGVVRAEEFNSVLEGALPIAQAAARGIDGMGGSVSKLRTAVTDGKVTSQQFFQGLLKGFVETEAQAEKSTLTIEGALTGVTNSWTRFIGELDKTSGASATAVAALNNVANALGEIADQLARGAANGKGFWATMLEDSRRTGRMGGLRLSTPEEMAQDRLKALQGERNTPQAQGRESMIDAEIQALMVDRQIRFQEDEDWARRGKLDPVAPPSAPPPAKGKGGQSPAEKYKELIDQLNIARDAQNAMTTAARAGDVAFQEQQATLDATQKLYDIFNVRLRETDPRLAAVRDRLLEIAQGKAAESFNVATTELEKQNVLLKAQIDLRDELPEIQAKELAQIKAKQDAEKAGGKLSQDEIERRYTAIEQNEKLKSQQEELKKAQELWTEPLKQALRDIQSIGADAFDKLLENGKFSFEELGATFMRIIRRMAAEFLALATIRPVMSVLVNAISPSMAQSMGLGSTGLGGIGGSGSSGGFSGISLPSWLGGGSVGGFLGSPISGAFPSTQYGPPAPGQGWSSGFLGDITWGQGLGALAGAGMGVYQLATGNGSLASTIGGISSIVGAGLSLIPGIGPILGPAVGLLGNLIPGLFGSTPPTITNQTYGQLTYGSGGWYTTGGAWGPSANSSATESSLRSLGGNISAVFDLLGGVKDPGKVWGLSAQNKTVSGQGWSSSSDSTYLVDPWGNQQLWRMNESNMMDTGSAQVAYRSILEGAVGEITENMRKAVTQTGQTMGGTSLQAIAETVAEVLAFDKAIADLGKTMLTAEAAIKQIDDSFAGMYATAEKYGLATGDVDAAKAKARLGYAADFGKSISREILRMTDPTAAALADLDDWKAGAIENNKWLIENVTDALDQINEIEKLYGLRRAAIVEQSAAASLTSLADVIKRLTYGDLSGASPAATLSGLQGTYSAMLAKANAGDATAIAGLGGAAADYAQFAGTYYGTATPTYQSLVGNIRGSLSNVYAAQGGTDPLIAALTTVSAQFANSEQDNAELKAEMEEVTTAVTVLTEKLQRLLDKMAA